VFIDPLSPELLADGFSMELARLQGLFESIEETIA